MGLVCSGPVCIYFPQDFPGTGPETDESHLRALACRCFGNGTRSFGTHLHLFHARLSGYETRNQRVLFAYSGLQALWQRDLIVRDPFAFISRKT